jgi:hypothetical protein
LLQYLEKIKLVKDLNEKRKNAVLELNYTHDQVNNITEKMRTKKPERVLELNSLFHQKILEYEDVCFIYIKLTFSLTRHVNWK